MMPLKSVPSLHHIAAQYAAQGIPVILGVHQAAHVIRNYVRNHPELNAECVDIGETSSLGETIARLLRILPGLDSLIVHFADTLVGDELSDGDFICCQKREDLYRWTAFEIGVDGKIQGAIEKDKPKPHGCELPVFVGLFGFANPRRFTFLLEEYLADPDSGLDPFYSAVIEYFNGLSLDRRKLIEVNDWLDLGHLDTYYGAKQTFFLESRAFNSLSVDLGRGIIIKKSQDFDKFRDEIEWYIGLPSHLQYLAPRVFRYSTDPDDAFVEIEFYAYPTLNDIYLYGEWDLGVWSQVLSSIGHALDGMTACVQPGGTEESRRQAMEAMYVAKTRTRVEPLLSDPRFEFLMNDSVTINGRSCMGFRRALEAIPRMMKELNMYHGGPFSLIHGDLCLSNILYDRRAGFVRLIDPRGSFGGVRLYGDPRYELAKLSHSFHGDYDLLLNGLFELQVEEDRVSLVPAIRRGHREIKRLFRAWLLHRSSDIQIQIAFIEALLFLSMAALHADRPQSQLAFVVRGLEILQSTDSRLSEPWLV
jgi:hypothetical protein